VEHYRNFGLSAGYPSPLPQCPLHAIVRTVPLGNVTRSKAGSDASVESYSVRAPLHCIAMDAANDSDSSLLADSSVIVGSDAGAMRRSTFWRQDPRLGIRSLLPDQLSSRTLLAAPIPGLVQTDAGAPLVLAQTKAVT
jgi:hypothetical protein